MAASYKHSYQSINICWFILCDISRCVIKIQTQVSHIYSRGMHSIKRKVLQQSYEQRDMRIQNRKQLILPGVGGGGY